MPNDPNTKDNPVDTDDWEIAFGPFSEDPGAALMLGFNFMVLKNCLAVRPLKVQEVIKSLDCAMEVLFQHTDFHEISYALFIKLAGGKLSLEEEGILRALGVKF